MSESTEIRLRADTHVHFHPCFDESLFLDSAAASLKAHSANSNLVSALMCLTESHDANWFGRLAQLGSDAPIGTSGWRVRKTRENNSVVVSDDQGRRLAVIAGRQIVCEEGLELLALGYAELHDDGGPIRKVLKHVADSGALPVLPWSFGKWMGSRGEIVKQLLEDPPCDFALGDNSGRLAILGEPALFRTARSRGIAILPGTDPFPFRWDASRVGSFGIEWRGGLDPDAPFQSLKSLLANQSGAGEPFGRLESIPAFIRNQVAIRLRHFVGSTS